jgi:hypothetical protein
MKMYLEDDVAFKMALGQMMTWGTKKASIITDTEIESVHMDMIADWLLKRIYLYAREMAKIEIDDYGSLIKFCMVEKLFDTKGFKPRKR